ncbi:hypothetical protein ACHQM5_017039 [Ranunculus cassubicifolius]
MITGCSNKKKVSDRLSSLPDDLVDTIFKFLPVRDVVRTSALAQFWRCRWMSIPNFIFNAHSSTSTEPMDSVIHLLSLANDSSGQSAAGDYLQSPCSNFDTWMLIQIRIQDFSAGCVLSERLCNTFSHLNHVALLLNFQNSLQISTLICLLKSSPSLQTVNFISYSNVKLMYVDKEEMWETRLHQEEDLPRMLRTVRINNFKGTHQELRLVKFIHNKAVGLQIMNTHFDTHNYEDEEELAPLLKILVSFRRSSKAKCRLEIESKRDQAGWNSKRKKAAPVPLRVAPRTLRPPSSKFQWCLE